MPANATKKMNDADECMNEFIQMFMDLHQDDLVEILELSEMIQSLKS
jgi:hypothetical protein